MRIGELARRTGLAPSAIRYYERLDFFSPGQIARHPNGYRDYTDDAERRLRLIIAGRAAGFSLADMRHQMADWEMMSIEQKADILGRQLSVIDARIDELAQSRTTISAVLDQLGRRTTR